MAKRPHVSPAVRRISLTNYKGIDQVELELPAPLMAYDPDVAVIGSENGLGKTSILECCSLVLSALATTKKQFPLVDLRYRPFDIPDMMIRAGTQGFKLSATVSLGERCYEVSLSVNRKGMARVTGDEVDSARQAFGGNANEEGVAGDLVNAIAGLNANPVVAEPFLLFHSYRKVQEGNPELGMMAEDRQYVRRPPFGRRPDISLFKMTILRSLMQQADLFELSEAGDSTAAIDRLNDLLDFYVGGTISKLRPRADNSVDFRVQRDGENESFTFDGLSSGQKEVISTLFMIWYYTRERPRVVLIDEPELHLNLQWHRSFVGKLFDLAPRNQYIFATHSADFMDSVDPSRRLILSS